MTMDPAGCVVRLNGIQLYCEIHGNGEPLVLLHGFSGTSQDWKSSIPELTKNFQLIGVFKGIGISGGGNILLHMATRQPDRVKAMVLVSATPYFPPSARTIMRQYQNSLPESQLEVLRRNHPGGNEQVKALLVSTTAFADSYDDMNFTPPYPSTIKARTLIVQGDRDPLYPVEISIEMYKAIPNASLWVVPNAGHGPVIGSRWPEFLKTAAAFLR